MFERHVITTLAAAAAIATAVAGDAHAGNLGNLSGWATRDWQTFHSTFIDSGELTYTP
jgi:hypothetical protein